MKIFNKPTLQTFQLEQITTESKRFYINEEGVKFYSVTSFLSKTADKSFLIKWRETVGDKEADIIVKESVTFGTKLHLSLEKLLFNEEEDLSLLLESDEQLKLRFNPIKDYLEKNVAELLGSEIVLFSKKLKLAGTCDLVYLDHEGNIVIADFKTSRKKKILKWCEDYCLQICCYSLMISELYNIFCSSGKLLFSYSDGTFEVIQFDPTKYFGTLQARLKMFKNYLKDEEVKKLNEIF